MTMDLPLSGRSFLAFVDDAYEDLELWYPKLRLLEAGWRNVCYNSPYLDRVMLPQMREITDCAMPTSIPSQRRWTSLKR